MDAACVHGCVHGISHAKATVHGLGRHVSRDACSRGDEGVEVPGALPTSSRCSCVRPSPHIVHGRWAQRRHGGKRCERVDVGPIR
jgi:hypothetical protein